MGGRDRINIYLNTGTAINPNFTLQTENPLLGYNYFVPTLQDIDNDGDFDLFVGEDDGNINFYRNTGTATNFTFGIETENLAASFDIGSQSHPTLVDIDNDGDLDLAIGELGGNINFYRNTDTTTNPRFTFEVEDLGSINAGFVSHPTFVDIDNDGDFDLFVGESDGNINFYRNTGTAGEPIFSLETESFAAIDVGIRSSPTFADVDADGDFDLLVGENDGNINFYRNTGTATNPNFVVVTENLASIDVGDISALSFVDIDNDGDLDLFVGESRGNINFYRRTGTAIGSIPTFTLETDNFSSISIGTVSVPTFADIDNDGDSDLFVGELDGGLNFYRNLMLTSVDPREIEMTPNVFDLSQNYPNPFNPETEIRFQLPKANHVVVKIFNAMGQEIRVLVNANFEAGYHSARWDGKDVTGIPVSSGVYLYQLQAGNFSQVKRMSLLR